MSGGRFDYNQLKISQIAEEVEHLIYTNGNSRKDEWGDEMYQNFPPDIIQEFRIAVHKLKEACVYAQRIDWLVSGDDGEGNFKVRLAKDLEKLQHD